MSCLLVLNSLPVLGFNSEYRLAAAEGQINDDQREDDCFAEVNVVSNFIITGNAFSIGGCLPGVCVITGIARLYLTIALYEISAPEDPDNKSDAWMQDRKWTCIKMGTLAVAEILHLGVILAPLHVIATLFDCAVAAHYHSTQEIEE